jgi:hypothetical protein
MRSSDTRAAGSARCDLPLSTGSGHGYGGVAAIATAAVWVAGMDERNPPVRHDELSHDARDREPEEVEVMKGWRDWLSYAVAVCVGLLTTMLLQGVPAGR